MPPALSNTSSFEYNAYMIKTMLLGLIQCFQLQHSGSRFNKTLQGFNKMPPGSLRFNTMLPVSTKKLPGST